MASWRVVQADALEGLRALPDGCVQTCVTSPPYFGLRDYGTGEWEGGDDGCDHLGPPLRTNNKPSDNNATFHGGTSRGTEPWKDGVCGKCGARRTDSQLGLEPTPDEYVARLVEVMREVRRVLRDDGTLWLNLGDSYSGSPRGNQGDWSTSGLHGATTSERYRDTLNSGTAKTMDKSRLPGVKQKDLLGIPWMVAFALRADGWVLRQEVIWQKPNPMPESVTDRCTKSHEQLFMFSKAKWVGPEPGRFAHISNEDARWLALLFDAEGNIVIKRAEREGRVQYGAQVTFANTHRGLIERARSIVGMGSIHERVGCNAPMFYWQMSGRQARDLLHRIYPFLIVKPRQAAVAIHMQDVVAEPKRRPGGYRSAEHAAFLEKCWRTIKALNSFGDPDISWVPEPKMGRWTAGPRYFYDADAIREDGAGRLDRGDLNRVPRLDSGAPWNGEALEEAAGRNKRSVWTVATQPFPGAHFAVFPPKLIEPCVLAGSAEQACGVCGAPWERVVERDAPPEYDGGKAALLRDTGAATHRSAQGPSGNGLGVQPIRTLGFEPSCDHQDNTGTSTVLDPFCGAGTTGLVATRNDRSFVGIELNPAYAEMARQRVRDDQPLMNYLSETA